MTRPPRHRSHVARGRHRCARQIIQDVFCMTIKLHYPTECFGLLPQILTPSRNCPKVLAGQIRDLVGFIGSTPLRKLEPITRYGKPKMTAGIEMAFQSFFGGFHA